MTLTNFPSGVSSFGVPVIGGQSLPTTTGKYVFVSSVTGSNGNNGLTPALAVATVLQAKVICDTNKDDIIVVMANHTENITNATDLVIDKAGVRVIGLGIGSARPTFTFTTATTAKITITGKNIGFYNCIFIANFADVATAFLVGASPEFQLIGCEFRDTSSILNMLACVTTTVAVNADGMRFEQNRIKMLGTTAATVPVKILGTMSRLTVNDNFVTKAVLNNTSCLINHAALVMTDLECARNIINSANTDSATGGFIIVTTSTTNTGHVYDNKVIGLDTAAAVLITATGHKYGQTNNLYSGDVDTSGFVLPAIGTDA